MTIGETMNAIGLWLIRNGSYYKDRSLAIDLHYLANKVDPFPKDCNYCNRRPTEGG
jgi:hypothetical protein